jgi:hypothetical protein
MRRLTDAVRRWRQRRLGKIVKDFVEKTDEGAPHKKPPQRPNFPR